MSEYSLNYPLEYYKPLFSEERWEQILEVVNNWRPIVLDTGETIKEFMRNPETGMIVFVSSNQDTYTAKANRVRVLERYLHPEELWKCQMDGHNTYSKEREKKTYDEATKLTEDEYGDTPIYANDNYYYDGIYGLREMEGDDVPDYVFGVHDHSTLLPETLDEMLDRHFESLNLEDYDRPAIPEYLRHAWSMFCTAHDTTYYTTDTKTIIILNKDEI